MSFCCFFFFFQAEDGIRDYKVTGVQTCALPISLPASTTCQPAWLKLLAHASPVIPSSFVLPALACRPAAGAFAWSCRTGRAWRAVSAIGAGRLAAPACQPGAGPAGPEIGRAHV